MIILAVIVTYYPEQSLLRKNINAFIDYVDKVIIWENTPEADKFQFRFIQDDKVKYSGDGVNSISHALNYAWHYAQENGYDYLLTMDQDSVWENFQMYKDIVESENDTGAIYCPNINNDPSICNPKQVVEYGITSGMLVPVEVLNKIGGYDEQFTIDGIDLDFCLKAKYNGIKTWAFKECVLKQRFGQPIEKKIIWKTIQVTSYSTIRLYSIYKGHIILLRRYKVSKLLKRRLLKNYLYYVPRNILLFEKEKRKKISAIIKGIYSGMVCKV